MNEELSMEKEVFPIEKEDIKNEGNFIVRLQTSYPLLWKSEKKIADYLQQHADQRIDYSITEFGKLLNVSEATVSRFCRAVGFQGFQDLKLSLATSLNPAEEFKNVPIDIHETDSMAEIGKKLVDTLATNLIETQRNLNTENILAAVDAIVQAKHVGLFGIGGSSTVLSAANHLFVKAGINCSVYNDGYMQTVIASLLNENSVAIGVSNTGLSMTVVNALKIASENNAVTICITSNSTSPLAQFSQICLLTALTKKDIPLYGDFLEARMSQLYIIDLLYLGILFKLGDLSKKNLQRSTEVLKTYYNPIE